MVGFAYRALIQAATYELGRLLQHDISAPPCWLPDDLPHSVLAVAQNGTTDAGCEAKLWVAFSGLRKL
jgi:hypothetical protein